MSWKLLYLSAALPGFGTEITVASCHIVGFCLVDHAGYVEFLKPCDTLGAVVLRIYLAEYCIGFELYRT